MNETSFFDLMKEYGFNYLFDNCLKLDVTDTDQRVVLCLKDLKFDSKTGGQGINFTRSSTITQLERYVTPEIIESAYK